MARSRGQCRVSVRTTPKEPQMNPSPATRKVFQGVASRQQMFRMFDRHAQRPNRWEGDAAPLYAGEWFEIAETEHDYMFEILPPLWIRGSMFAMREYLTGGQNKSCSKSYAKTERSGNVMQRGGFFQEVAMA